MKFISFKKYTKYLESLGYSKENGENLYENLSIRSVFYSKPGEKNKYWINIFLNTDKLISINYGYGCSWFGYKSINIDMRQNFWKNLTCED
jgi:hypothetical protein